MAFPKAFVWGQFASAAMPDAQAAREHFASGRRQRDSIIGDASAFTWGGGRMADAWPANADEGDLSRMRTSNTETLVIGGELDFATPPQVATKELLPYLPKGHQVVLPGFGHSTSVWTEQPEAGSRLINTFFDSGKIDRSLYKPQKVDFTPEVSQSALGKGFAGTMVGLALLTLLSLLWMPRRVHKRGHFGRKTSAMLRSLYAIVLGLGGWFLGVLIVITTMPGVPLNHALLAVLSVGVPVGLGTYWAWVHRDWPAQSKRVGLAAAAAGALAGAWLGLHAAVDLLALITAIVGAVAGANLTLILLDMSRARSADGRVAPETANASAPSVEPA